MPEIAVPFSLVPLTAAAFLVSLATVVVPGPITIVASRLAIAHSTRAAAWFLLGVIVLDCALFTALVAGAAPPLRQLGAMPVVEILGGLVLLWVGLASLRTSRSGQATRSAEGLRMETTNSTGYLMLGIAVAIGNPHYWIWWVTAGLAFIEAGRQHGLPGLLWILAALIGGVLAWYCPLLVTLHQGRTLLTPRREKLVVRGMGIALILLGLGLAGLGSWRLARPHLGGGRIAGRLGEHLAVDKQLHQVGIQAARLRLLLEDRQRLL